MSKSFDFVVEAKEVIIKKKCHNKYQVKIAGIGDFLKYQTWSSTNTNNVNGKRSVSFVNAKNWVQNNFSEKKLINVNVTIGPMFTPTAIMEVCNKKYIFVIESATYNKDKKYNTVLNVSTTQIVKNNITKDLVKLPVNKKLNNVRFDIDSSNSVVVDINKIVVNSSNSSVISGTYVCPGGRLSFTTNNTNNVYSVTVTNDSLCSQSMFFFDLLQQVFNGNPLISYDPPSSTMTISQYEIIFTLYLSNPIN
jgi:hypothetical protein